MSAAVTDTGGYFADLGEGFRRAAEAFPDRPALRLPDREVTYSELDDLSARWAHRVTDMLGRRPHRIGVLAGRNLVGYAGILAAVRAGSAFVPLNSAHPLQRTLRTIQAAELDLVVISASELPGVLEMSGSASLPPLFLPDGRLGALAGALPAGSTDETGIAEMHDVCTRPAAEPEDMAYVMFTSGTSGVPKGVCISQANIRSLLDTCQRRYRLTCDDRLTQTFELTFDLSVFDMFMAWEAGACLVPLSTMALLAPVSFVDRHQISVWFSVPSVAQFVERRGALSPGSMPTLRWSLFCGERLPQRTAQLWQQAAPNSTVENLYGPTELTLVCSAYRWHPDTSPAECVDGVVPIGSVFDSLTARVAPVDGAPLIDVPGIDDEVRTGELWVSGPQTSSGYWREPTLTAARFSMRRVADGQDVVEFRTGDLVQLRGDLLVHRGRVDDQVQVLGNRVEIPEVEGALLLAGAAEAAVLPWPDSLDCDFLTAFVAGGEPEQLRRNLADLLPPYMVPRLLVAVSRLPLNVNGKVDRTVLRARLREEVDARG